MKEKRVRAGYYSILKKTFQMPNGKHKEYDILESNDVAIIFALTSDSQVILTREYRPGPEEVLIELPKGAIDKGEKPEDAASRELLEETGYAGEVLFIGKTVHSAYSTRINYIFAATNGFVA